MTEKAFWELIDSVKGYLTYEDHVPRIYEKLHALSRKDLAAFAEKLAQKSAAADHWDLWGVAYIHNGGCSNDSFSDFRFWLVYQGKEIYELGLKYPDKLADYMAQFESGASAVEGFGYLAGEVYEEKFGEEIPREPIAVDAGKGESLDWRASETQGEPWTEDDLEERLPNMTRVFKELNKTGHEQLEAEDGDTTVHNNKHEGWNTGIYYSDRAQEWAFATCDQLLEEINSHIHAKDFCGDYFDLVFPSIDLLVHVSDSAEIYPWEGQRVGKWRKRVMEIFERDKESLYGLHGDIDSERKRLEGIFDFVESQVTKEDL